MSHPTVPDADPEVRAIGAELALLAPAGAAFGVRPIDVADVDGLLPEELAAIEHALPRRRAEFATGRALLRQLLGTTAAIPVGRAGAPVLPPGFAGSLAHDRTVAVAVVAPQRTAGGLGIDIEPVIPLEPGTARLIVRIDDTYPDVIFAFAAKEAAYKVWSASGGRVLDHHEMRVEFDGLRFVATIPSGSWRVEGRAAAVAHRALAVAKI